MTPDRRRNDPLHYNGTERRKDVDRSKGAGIGAALVGALGAKGVASLLDPTAEDAYWSRNYEREPYCEPGYTYADYHPAYRTGWEGRARYEGRKFDEVERELEADYARNRGQSRLEWAKCRAAARAAWHRFDEPDMLERSQ